VPASDLALWVELNDANEPGVVLEMLVHTLVEVAKPVPVAVVGEIDRFAQEMGIDSSDLAGLRKLQEE
jgi:hypothetical protein